MDAISFQNVCKTFRKSTFTLDLPDLHIPEGYMTGFIGENGAGKTTAIKLMMNMLLPNQGNIRIFGKDVSEASVRAEIGYVGEEMGFPNGARLDSLIKMIRPFYPAWDQAEFSHITKRFGLTDLHQKYKDLSQGKRKQFALATALAHHPRLLLLDEPTANLDPLVRNAILTLLAERLEKGALTVLFSTHITSDLDKIADYLLFIHQGRILLQGGKDEILESHSIVKGSHELLTEESRSCFLDCQETEFGFRAVTSRIPETREILGREAVYEKALVEDIFLAYVKKGKDEWKS